MDLAQAALVCLLPVFAMALPTPLSPAMEDAVEQWGAAAVPQWESGSPQELGEGFVGSDTKYIGQLAAGGVDKFMHDIGPLSPKKRRCEEGAQEGRHVPLQKGRSEAEGNLGSKA